MDLDTMFGMWTTMLGAEAFPSILVEYLGHPLDVTTIVAFLFLVLVDVLGYPSLWDERLYRRVIHHAATGSFFPWRTLNAPILVALQRGASASSTLLQHQDVGDTGTGVGDNMDQEDAEDESWKLLEHDPPGGPTGVPARSVKIGDQDSRSRSTTASEAEIPSGAGTTSAKGGTRREDGSSRKKESRSPSSARSKLQPHTTMESVLRQEDVNRVLHILERNSAPETCQQYFREVQGLNTKSWLLSRLAGGQFSTRSTLYWNDFTPAGQKVMLEVGEALRVPLAKVLNLHDPALFRLGTSDFRCCLLRYEGKNASFGFHYDTEPWNCFRCLFLIKKNPASPVAPFLYWDADGELRQVALENIGDGLVFQGSRIFHGVAKTGDEANVRFMLGFQYRYGPDLESKRKNFCNQFRGKNSVFQGVLEIFLRCLPVLVLKELLVLGVAWLLRREELLERLSEVPGLATPRLLGCWFIPILSLFFVCGFDCVLVLLFAAYLCVTEHCLPSTWVDVLYEDKRKTLEIVRNGVVSLRRSSPDAFLAAIRDAFDREIQNAPGSSSSASTSKLKAARRRKAPFFLGDQFLSGNPCHNYKWAVCESDGLLTVQNVPGCTAPMIETIAEQPSGSYYFWEGYKAFLEDSMRGLRPWNGKSTSSTSASAAATRTATKTLPGARPSGSDDEDEQLVASIQQRLSLVLVEAVAKARANDARRHHRDWELQPFSPALVQSIAKVFAVFTREKYSADGKRKTGFGGPAAPVEYGSG
eukprot:g4818.t1